MAALTLREENTVHLDSMFLASLVILLKVSRMLELPKCKNILPQVRSSTYGPGVLVECRLLDTIRLEHGVPYGQTVTRSLVAEHHSNSHTSRSRCCCLHGCLSPPVELQSLQLGCLPAALPGTPRGPGTLHCCSVHKPTQQRETCPKPEGPRK